jgi:haloalkane dehalogenase
VANTGLPTGSGMTDGFKAWLEFSQSIPVMPIGMIVNGGTGRDLSSEEVAAYDAPFPDESYKEGARQFPALVPVTPEHASIAENLAAWEVLERFERPLVTAFSDGDAVTRGGEAPFQARVPGARGQPHVMLKGGHFLQEDCPADIAAVIDGMIAARLS